MTRARPSLRVRAVLATALLLALGGCLSPRAVEANRVLADIAAGAGPSRLKQTTPAPERRAVAYIVGTRQRAADLYVPGGGVEPAAGLVLVPGLAPEGKDDPRLSALAATLARARFLVLVPDIASLRAQRVDPANIREIADALVHLTDPDAGLAAGRAGLTAISYAVGPALLAALEPDVRDRVGLFVGVGGYHDLEAVIAFFTTGHYRARPDGPWRRRTPNEYGKWVFVEGNLARLSDARDRELLRAMTTSPVGRYSGAALRSRGVIAQRRLPPAPIYTTPVDANARKATGHGPASRLRDMISHNLSVPVTSPLVCVCLVRNMALMATQPAQTPCNAMRSFSTVSASDALSAWVAAQ